MTYYQLLNISPTAVAAEVRSAYRKKAFLVHPDRNKSPNANHQFIAIRQAYEVLSNPRKRAEYDAKLGVSKFEDSDRRQYEPSSAEQKLHDLYEEIEYLKQIHYDPVEEWLTLYRIGWKDWYSIPKKSKLMKIGVELLFRSAFAVLGSVLAFFPLVAIVAANKQHISFFAVIGNGMIVVALVCFVFAKQLGEIYRNMKEKD